jgi:hypothetical protein
VVVAGFFSEREAMPTSASIDAYTLFIILFNKGLIKIIHQNIQNHHTIPINLTMDEDHANMALLLGTTKNPIN